MAVAVIIHEGASAAPTPFAAEESRFTRHIGESSVAIVAIENVVAPVGDKQILIAVVVVIPDANTLSPPHARELRFGGHISESAVPVIAIEVIGGRFARCKSFQSGSNDEKDIQPSVVVIIEESRAAAGVFKLVFILALAAVNGFGADSGLARDIGEFQA